MASVHKEYLYRDNFDAVLDITESDFLGYTNEFQQNMNLAVKKNLRSIIDRPIHVLSAPKFVFQKVKSPDISTLNIT